VAVRAKIHGFFKQPGERTGKRAGSDSAGPITHGNLLLLGETVTDYLIA
jgi:hypothetical protein